jgi:hypothetical protein
MTAADTPAAAATAAGAAASVDAETGGASHELYSTSTTEQADVLVLGAGIAGLAAAAALRAQGLSVLLLEGRNRIGEERHVINSSLKQQLVDRVHAGYLEVAVLQALALQGYLIMWDHMPLSSVTPVILCMQVHEGKIWLRSGQLHCSKSKCPSLMDNTASPLVL